MQSIFLAARAILLFVAVTSASAQGLNNDHPIDATDIENALKVLGVDVFKFPILSPDASSGYVLNYVLEEYREGNRTASISILDSVLTRIPASLPVSKVFSASALSSTPRMLRVYVQRRSASEVTLGYGFDNDIQQVGFAIDTAKYGPAGARAMSFTALQEGTRTPLVVFYANGREEKLLKCPADASPDVVRTMYPYAIILYGEPRKK